MDRKLFEKEGLRCEMTFTAGESVSKPLPPGLRISLPCRPFGRYCPKRGSYRAGRRQCDEWAGWILAVRADSKVQSVKELDGAKVGITSVGRELTVWLYGRQTSTKSPSRGCGRWRGLVPTKKRQPRRRGYLFASQLSLMKEKSIRVLVDFSKAMPPT